ncbi:hypothetical protein C4D60_Mb09t16130 [Musa balbisiana]|uniref:TLC domain-containing protein n=1 Tax=Musa balbisiana TaxID=52838 RepID=A0A4S8IGV2_MUSBA|nr:hypothetical protein C4D60_Mb09t16130 [Musa balbisiana]
MLNEPVSTVSWLQHKWDARKGPNSAVMQVDLVWESHDLNGRFLEHSSHDSCSRTYRREVKNKSHSEETPTTPTTTPIALFLVSGLGIPRYNPSIQLTPICCSSSSSTLPPKTSLEPAPLRDFPESGYGTKVLQAYDFTQFISSFYFKGYSSLTKIQRIDWNNRGMSSIHAIFVTIMSIYLVFCSDLFSDNSINLPITFRSSSLSTFGLGVSVGYFLADLAMIAWSYPSLGGMEYVIHHTLSAIAVAYTMLSGEGQFYTYLVLISEITTPGINLRWFLDTAGMKRSQAYLVNGAMVFLAWLVARILLFIYLFYHIFLHYDQVRQMHSFGYLLIFVVPSALAIMNIIWFGKILKGLRKALSKGK